MSYNYDQCVQSIQEHRRRAHAEGTQQADLEALQQSMDGFANLSKHCPMTPLLWMQYAHDTEVLMEGLMMLESTPTNNEDGGGSAQYMQAKKSALESSTGILELALSEFPGCALLHLYYLESLADYIYQSEGLRKLNDQSGVIGMEVDDRQATLQKFSAAFEHAWSSVGSGSHVNEGIIVSEIYQLQGSFILYLLSSVKDSSEMHSLLQQLSNLFLKWSKTPMGEGSNDEMMQDMEYLWDEACSVILLSIVGEEQKLKQSQELQQQKAILWESIDVERKKTSSLMNTLSSNENEIDVAMSNEGISLPRMTLFPQQQDESNETDLLARQLQSLKRSSAKWNHILVGETNRFLSGLGGSETSRAFLRATSFLQRKYQDMMKKGKNSGKNADPSPIEEYVATYKDSAITSMYERAISECPTVESLWVSYMNFLRGEWTRLRSNIKGQKHMLQGEELYLQQQQQGMLATALQSTSQRPIRNCRYSCTLFEIRMTTLGLIAVSNLEPDDITAIVQAATELGFLNHNREAMLHLRLTAILVVKRRLLSLVSLGTTTSTNGNGKDYDEEEEAAASSGLANNKKTANGATVLHQPLNPSVMEEVQDLLEDIRDMYDEADNFLFKTHPTWAEGKVAFWKHRAQTEAYVLCPLGLALKEADDEMNGENDAVADKEAIKCFEKLVKAQKPSHPDSWRDYIRYISASQLYVMGSGSSSTHTQPDGIAMSTSTLRKVRGLYQRAMGSMKKAGQEAPAGVLPSNAQSWMGEGIDGAMCSRDYDFALSDLCREYLDFERTNGSEESFANAQTLVRSKLADWVPPSVAVAMAATVSNDQEETNGKRKLEISNDGSQTEGGPSSMITDMNEQQDGDDTQSKSKRVKVVTNLKQPKKTEGVHKVRVGKMDYPAHPFTIHVSNLSKETQDMDLVDVFRSEFGGVVHAKILREKRTGKGGHHYHGESKCAGLVQFEERQCVENALQKNGEFEVGGKLVKIQRSHLPAVGVVPAGMHRVNPKGEGKVSKKNKLKKEAKMKVDTTTNDSESMDVEEKEGNAGGAQNREKKTSRNASESPSALSLGVLSFKPRGMRQKPKISLNENTKKK